MHSGTFNFERFDFCKADKHGTQHKQKQFCKASWKSIHSTSRIQKCFDYIENKNLFIENFHFVTEFVGGFAQHTFFY